MNNLEKRRKNVNLISVTHDLEFPDIHSDEIKKNLCRNSLGYFISAVILISFLIYVTLFHKVNVWSAVMSPSIYHLRTSSPDHEVRTPKFGDGNTQMNRSNFVKNDEKSAPVKILDIEDIVDGKVKYTKDSKKSAGGVHANNPPEEAASTKPLDNEAVLLKAAEPPKEEKDEVIEHTIPTIEEIEAQVTKVANLKNAGVVMETDPTALKEIGILQDLLREYLPVKYGPEPYIFDMSIQFPASMHSEELPDTEKIVIELAPTKLVPYTVFYTMKILNDWKV